MLAKVSIKWLLHLQRCQNLIPAFKFHLFNSYRSLEGLGGLTKFLEHPSLNEGIQHKPCAAIWTAVNPWGGVRSVLKKHTMKNIKSDAFPNNLLIFLVHSLIYLFNTKPLLCTGKSLGARSWKLVKISAVLVFTELTIWRRDLTK